MQRSFRVSLAADCLIRDRSKEYTEVLTLFIFCDLAVGVEMLRFVQRPKLHASPIFLYEKSDVWLRETNATRVLMGSVRLRCQMDQIYEVILENRSWASKEKFHEGRECSYFGMYSKTESFCTSLVHILFRVSRQSAFS